MLQAETPERDLDVRGQGRAGSRMGHVVDELRHAGVDKAITETPLQAEARRRQT